MVLNGVVYDVVRCGVVYEIVCCGVVWCGAVWYLVRYSVVCMVRYYAVWLGVVLYGMVWCGVAVRSMVAHVGRITPGQDGARYMQRAIVCGGNRAQLGHELLCRGAILPKVLMALNIYQVLYTVPSSTYYSSLYMSNNAADFCSRRRRLRVTECSPCFGMHVPNNQPPSCPPPSPAPLHRTTLLLAAVS